MYIESLALPRESTEGTSNLLMNSRKGAADTRVPQLLDYNGYGVICAGDCVMPLKIELSHDLVFMGPHSRTLDVSP
jgi:hypothetical protein